MLNFKENVFLGMDGIWQSLNPSKSFQTHLHGRTVVLLVRKISNANPGNGMCQTTNVLRLDAKLVSSMTNPYLSLTPKGPKVGLVEQSLAISVSVLIVYKVTKIYSLEKDFLSFCLMITLSFNFNLVENGWLLKTR